MIESNWQNMKSSFSLFYISVVLFGCCAWTSSCIFTFKNMKWLFEPDTPQTLLSAINHSYNLRAMIAGVLSALIWSYPVLMIYKHRWSFAGYLLLMPAAIISTAAIYLAFWPPQRQTSFQNALAVLLATGWLEFLISYLVIVFAPLQIISIRIQRTLGASIEDSVHGQ